jgi:predicted transcriptional regulator
MKKGKVSSLAAILVSVCMAGFSVGGTLQGPNTVAKELLNQDTRNAVYEVVKTNPGIHFREICRVMDKKMGVVQYHARLLEEAGLIQSFGDGRYKRFCVPETLGSKDDQVFTQKLVGFLQRGTSEQIIQILLNDATASENGDHATGTRHGVIAEALGLTSQAVTWHAKKLAQDGIIQVQKIGREKFYSLTPEALQFLNNKK